MKKNILVLSLVAGLIAMSGGCTSKESQSDEQAIENADVEKIETIDSIDDEASAVAAEPAPSDAPAVSDEMSLEASLDAEPTAPTAEAAPAEAPPAELTETPVADTAGVPTIDESAMAMTDSAPAVTETQLSPETNAITEIQPETSTEITETPIVDATPFMAESSPVDSTPKVAAGSALKKVMTTTPYQAKSGGWVNTVYISRPNEKLADISQKIFGMDKTQELKAIAENSFLKWRAPKGGDKIYYVSPNRPEDSAKTMLYQEDMGLVPQTYVAKEGQNLRKVAKELLGYDNAWKEIWTSNSVDSKTSLKDGEILRYWTDQSEVMAATPPSPPPGGANIVDSAPPATATMSPPPSGDAMAAAPPPADTNLPPPPADANASLPPPPTDAMAAAPVEATPPPVEDAPPPPPPPADEGEVAAADKVDLDEAAAEEDEGTLSTDTMMSMGALGVLVALLAFVIIRKKKQKAQMNNLEMNA